MQAKSGFVLRHVLDEYILMPTGDNISVFDGTVMFNETAALVWQKLQSPVTREELLQAVMDEYDVEEAVAAADLDKLLQQMKKDGILLED